MAHFKVKTFGLDNLAALVRTARGKSPRRRDIIAQQAGMSRSTIDRKIRALQNRRGLDRKGRTDKGRSRKLSHLWTRMMFGIFFKLTPPNYAQLYREIVARCARKGIACPSYSSTLRSVNSSFRQLMDKSRIHRVGDFIRQGKKQAKV